MLRRDLFCLATALTFAVPGCDTAEHAAADAHGVPAEGKPAADANAAKPSKFDQHPLQKKAEATTPDATPTKPRGKQIPPPENLAAAPANADKTSTGVACVVLTPGTGTETIGLNDSVKMHYTGWTADGATVETTDGRKTARTIKVNRTPVQGWSDALQLMKAGEKRRCWIPEDQAFVGRRGAPEGPLVYDIEVQEVMKAPPTPEDVAAPPADAEKTASGLAYKLIKAGPGNKNKHPRAWDKATVDYSGWTTDGKMFDSSVARGKPATFGLDKVIPGWTEGVQLMAKGDTTRFWIPEALAYKGQPGKPAGMLVFDITLNDWEALPEPPPPPPVPEDVAAPPDDATKTESGLAYKVLKKGKGKTHPGETTSVQCHYSGWTTDGKMFDSSVARGKPATFALNRVIKGWTEGVQLMAQGDKFRLWIPEDLAYQGRPGKPAGMLVFDIELLEVMPDAPTPAAVPGRPAPAGNKPAPTTPKSGQ